jgi:hypothetical protein
MFIFHIIAHQFDNHSVIILFVYYHSFVISHPQMLLDCKNCLRSYGRMKLKLGKFIKKETVGDTLGVIGKPTNQGE